MREDSEIQVTGNQKTKLEVETRKTEEGTRSRLVKEGGVDQNYEMFSMWMDPIKINDNATKSQQLINVFSQTTLGISSLVPLKLTPPFFPFNLPHN